MLGESEMDINQIRIANLKRIILEDYGDSVHRFAKAIGRHSSQFYALFNGERSFGQNLARDLEIELKIPKMTLDRSADEETIIDQVMFIPPYSTDISLQTSLKETANNIFVIEKFIAKRNNWQLDKFYGLIMDDESMSPTIQYNSKVLIDTSATKIENGKIYALSKNNEIFLRRVFRQLGSTAYEAKSDNEKYGTTTFKTDGSIKVIGRIVCLLNQIL